MTQIYLTRHGETEWNVLGRWQGWRDSPLTERGVRQAESLARALGDVRFDAIYASSSGRTMRTAEIVGRASGVPVVAADALREIYHASWEGCTHAQIRERYPHPVAQYHEEPDAYRSPVGGESFHDVMRRVDVFWRDLLAASSGQRVLLVSHTVPVKLLTGAIAGRPLARLWDPPVILPTSLTQIEVEGAATRIVRIGDMSHWQSGEEAQ